MRLAALALGTLAAVGLSSSSASAQYLQPSYGPRISVGVVTPGGFSFGYSNVRPGYYAPLYSPVYYPQPQYYYPGHYDYHHGHYHYHPGHSHSMPGHRH